MITNLPANLDNERDLMKASGQQPDEPLGLALPVLRVNYDAEDDGGGSLPRGRWAMSLTDGTKVYADKRAQVIFRPIFVTQQYSHFDSEKGKMVSKSVHFQSWNDEVPDSTGTFKCGKKPKKVREELSDAEKALQDKIKLSRVLFGVATFDALRFEGDLDENGNRPATAHRVESLPCVLYAKGTNYMPMTNFLDGLTDRKIPMQKVNINITKLILHKNGQVKYWEVVPEFGGEAQVTQEDLDLLRDFAETAKAETDQVLEKFEAAQKKKGGKEGLAEALSVGQLTAGATGDLEADLNDPLPDHLAGC